MFFPVGTHESPPRRRFPLVTTVLVLLNSLIFLYEFYLLFTVGDQALNEFITVYGLVPERFVSGQSLQFPYWLTPFSSMFVHGGLTHVGFNMLYLLAFGDNVEDRLGPVRYVLFYLLSGLAAALAHTYIDPGSPVPTVGASGAVSGVLAGYILLFPSGRVRVFFFLGPFSRTTRLSALVFVGFWLVSQLFYGVASLGVATAETAGIAYWAHIGGFAAGFILAFLFRRRPSRG
jgi:membrane associated rhomboid family serine protease